MKKLKELLLYVALACLTLGLAPFFPEPHIWDNLKWVAGGAVGMQTLDWLDLLMHGLPFILLIISLLVKINPENEEVL